MGKIVKKEKWKKGIERKKNESLNKENIKHEK